MGVVKLWLHAQRPKRSIRGARLKSTHSRRPARARQGQAQTKPGAGDGEANPAASNHHTHNTHNSHHSNHSHHSHHSQNHSNHSNHGVETTRTPSSTSQASGHIQYAESPVPGSPVTFSPQLPSEPFAFSRDDDGVSTTHHIQSKAVPTVFTWGAGGASVELEGSFDNWTSRHVMQKSGRDFSLVKLLSPGVYQYKFIVDGQWRHDPNLPCIYDDQGNINNVMEVQEYIAEDLSGLATFEAPPSPRSTYQNPIPSSEDFQKEPPSIPPQLQLSLLNVPTNMGMNASAANLGDSTPSSKMTYMDSLPRPGHVVLNHLYSQRTSGNGVIVIGSTHRYKSKYVTTVLFRARSNEGDEGLRNSMLHRIVRQDRDHGMESSEMHDDVTSMAM